jgi:hypothetical protein
MVKAWTFEWPCGACQIWLAGVEGVKHTPFRPVAPEQTSRASRITIDGFLPEGFVACRRERWYAVLTPVMPVPMIAISHDEGSCSDEQYESMGCSSERQYDRV